MISLTLLATVAVLATLTPTTHTAKCRYSAEKLPGKIEKYNKCLSIGFDPSIEGCEKVERENHKLRRNDRKKCAELEKYLMKCGHKCSVDGMFGEFGDWSECSEECGGGNQTRSRECNNPAPMGSGADCEGESQEMRQCNTDPCPAPRRLSHNSSDRKRRNGGRNRLKDNDLKDLNHSKRLYCYKCATTADKAEDCTSSLCYGSCATMQFRHGVGKEGAFLNSSQIRLCAPVTFSDDELCKIYSHYNPGYEGTTCSVNRCATYLCNNGLSAVRWRLDRRCGTGYPLPDGNTSECNPEGEFPCCSRAGYGICGSEAFHCNVAGSTDYRTVKKWRDAGEPSIKWRFDRLCGTENPLPDGSAAECDPDGKYPCCSDTTDGKCGVKKRHCQSLDAIDYRLMKRRKEN